MKYFIEFFFLTFWIFPRVILFSFMEERKVRRLFYKKTAFKAADQLLKKLYYLKSSYSIYRKYAKSRGLSSLDFYGETPLTVFHQMFQNGGLSRNDCFVDLGCGRGRGVFFATTIWGCNSIGIERVPVFCKKAQEISLLLASQSHIKPPKIFCEEIGSFNLTLGSFFYFYAICMEEEDLIASISHLEKILSGSKLITVSFPITEYSNSFSLLSSWESTYPWGKTDIFLYVKNS